ncbi:MAG: HD domain-containing protein [Paludibacteraceae bacterium]|nr:HD domain-containing protein [Paludibacteraceae bacterium]
MNPEELIEKYYHQSPELKEILLTHSRQVRDRALRIVDRHPELQADRQFIEEAAMLHDIGIIFCDAPKIFCNGPHKYIEHGYLGAELLRKEGLPRHAGVAERHTGSGITLEQVIREELPLPEKDYCPQNVEEEIICYADKFYSKSHLNEEVDYRKVRHNIWRYGHEAIQRFDQWRQRFEPEAETTNSETGIG